MPGNAAQLVEHGSFRTYPPERAARMIALLERREVGEG